MSIILQYLGQFGILVASLFVGTVKFIPKMLVYVPKSPRGKLLYGGATVSSLALFNDDQYDALAHVFIHSGSTHDFDRVVREFMFSDVSFAKSAQNYLTGDYGRTMMIHVGLTGITLLPLGLMAAAGVKNAKAVTSSASLLAQYGTKIKNIKFSDFIPMFFKGPKPASGYGSLYNSIPPSSRQKFMKDFSAYFKKTTTKGKPANAKGTNSVHAQLSGLASKPTKLSQVKDIALRKDLLAIEAIITLFVAMWLATNGEASEVNINEAENDMTELDTMVSDTHNFYNANTILGGDIHKIKTTMKTDIATAKHIYVSYAQIGLKLTRTWLSLSEMDRLRFFRLILLQFRGIHNILNGKTRSTRINVSIMNAVLSAIDSHNLPDLVSALALQREIDTDSKKAIFTGSDKPVTFKYLFHFIGENDIIKELYADGAAVPISEQASNPASKAKNSKPASSTNTKDSKSNGSKKEKSKASDTKKKASATADVGNIPTVDDLEKDEYAANINISPDMLDSFNKLVKGNADV